MRQPSLLAGHTIMKGTYPVNITTKFRSMEILNPAKQILNKFRAKLISVDAAILVGGSSDTIL